MAKRGHAEGLASLFLFNVLLFLLWSCSAERTTLPVPERAQVYVSVNSIPLTVFVFDTESDSLIDSLKPPFEGNLAAVVCDPDETRFAIVQSAGAFSQDVVFYYATDSVPYVRFQIPTLWFQFDTPRGFLIGTVGTYGGVLPPRFDIYDVNSRELLFTDTITLGDFLRLDRPRHLAFGTSDYERTPGAGIFRNELCAYDYVNRQIHACWNILPDTSGRGHLIRSFALHPDGRRIYIEATHFSGESRLIAYDLQEDKPLFNLSAPGSWGEPQLSPDLRTVWVPNSGGLITLYDAETGTIQSVIDLGAYRIGESHPIRPSAIRFTPSGKKAYVMSDWRGGPILVIDVESLQVTKVWYLDPRESPSRRPLFMDIGPVE